MAKSARGIVPAAIRSERARMPMLRPIPGSPLSSSQTQAVTTSPRSSVPLSSRSAPSAAAMPPFRSADPRPQTAPSTIAAPNGSSRSVPAQRSAQPSVRTVSRWPESSSDRPPPLPRFTLQTIGRPGSTSSRCTSSAPTASSSSATTRANASSFPVTLGVRTARSRKSSAACSGIDLLPDVPPCRLRGSDHARGVTEGAVLEPHRRRREPLDVLAHAVGEVVAAADAAAEHDQLGIEDAVDGDDREPDRGALLDEYLDGSRIAGLGGRVDVRSRHQLRALRELRIPARDARAACDLLERCTVYGDASDLAGGAVCPPHEPPAGDDPHAHTGADGDEDEVVDTVDLLPLDPGGVREPAPELGELRDNSARVARDRRLGELCDGRTGRVEEAGAEVRAAEVDADHVAPRNEKGHF